MLPEFLVDMLIQPFLSLVQQRLKIDLLSLSLSVGGGVVVTTVTKSSPVSQVSKYDT